MKAGLLLLALTCTRADEVARIAPLTESYRTKNFFVTAPTLAIARKVGDAAERHRGRLASRWLGKALPTWKMPCALEVTLTDQGDGGATSLVFDRGKIISQHVQVEGKLDAILSSTLPHEITHLVLAHHFGKPVPRWAGEGAAVLAEPRAGRRRQEDLARQYLDEKVRAIPLSQLFALTSYPRDALVFFAESASVTRYLVDLSGRRAFLAFVKDGMAGGWDAAARRHYGFANVAELERRWMKAKPEVAVEPP